MPVSGRCELWHDAMPVSGRCELWHDAMQVDAECVARVGKKCRCRSCPNGALQQDGRRDNFCGEEVSGRPTSSRRMTGTSRRIPRRPTSSGSASRPARTRTRPASEEVTGSTPVPTATNEQVSAAPMLERRERNAPWPFTSVGAQTCSLRPRASPASAHRRGRLARVGHSHADELGPASKRIRVLLGIALAPFAVATIVALVVLWPSHRFQPTHDLGPPAQLVDGTVTAVDTRPCSLGGSRCSNVSVDVTSGPDRGQTTFLPDLILGPGVPLLHPGEKIVLGRAVDSTRVATYYFADFQRRTPLAALAALFALLAVGIARWRGLAAIVGLGFAWLVLARFVMPAILTGRSAIAVALTAGAAIMFVVLYLAHGLNARTSTALLGTLASLALTGTLAAAFVAATHLTGMNSDDTTYLQTVAGSINLSGVVLGGIIIGSLGVLNDVTVTQASSVWEIHEANPTRGVRAIYRSGMRIGRDHIASTVYTLVLAYAGASLSLLILFSITSQPVGNIITGDLVAEEIVRTLVGSIGLIASVPITTLLAALVVSSRGAAAADAEPQAPIRRRPRLPKLPKLPSRPRRAARTESDGRSRAERSFWDQDHNA